MNRIWSLTDWIWQYPYPYPSFIEPDYYRIGLLEDHIFLIRIHIYLFNHGSDIRSIYRPSYYSTVLDTRCSIWFGIVSIRLILQVLLSVTRYDPICVWQKLIKTIFFWQIWLITLQMSICSTKLSGWARVEPRTWDDRE